MRIKFSIILMLSLLTYGCSGFNMSALKMLTRLNYNDKLKEQTLKQETANFEILREYVDNSGIEKGISTETVINKFGQPVVVLKESNKQKWIYKPANADWIGGEKIYLFFDKNGLLTDWECINCI